jgi:cobalt-zinc-cadmium efflux system outer membrane protein
MKTFTGLIGVLLVVFGCASVRTDTEWAQIKRDVRERTGKEMIWESSEKEELIIKKEVDRLLQDGLTRKEAVQIALINNRELQSTFEDIGISKSNLIQAGLFHNPSLSALFRIPLHGSGINVEIDGVLPLSDLWQMPFREKVASLRLEVIMKKVEQVVLETIRDAKKAYDSLYFSTLSKSLSESLFKKSKEISGEVTRRREFGFSTGLDVYMSQVTETEVQLELLRAQSNVSLAKTHLNRILGLRSYQTDYHIPDQEEQEIPPIPDKELALRHALQHRLDIQVARLKIGEAERKVAMEKWRILKEVHLGGSYEREVEGDAAFGPVVDIQLPLFDQNQAQIAKARFQLRKAKKRFQALEGHIREVIHQDLERIRLQQKKVKIYRQMIIPIRKKALEYADRWFKAMQLSRLHLLDAQKGLMESRLDYLKTRMELSHTMAHFEHHLGGKLPTFQ